jgi:hypothetical protein
VQSQGIHAQLNNVWAVQLLLQRQKRAQLWSGVLSSMRRQEATCCGLCIAETAAAAAAAAALLTPHPT